MEYDRANGFFFVTLIGSVVCARHARIGCTRGNEVVAGVIVGCLSTKESNNAKTREGCETFDDQIGLRRRWLVSKQLYMP